MRDELYIKAKEMGKELSLQYFLHTVNYTYFNMNRLTYKQIKQILDGYEAIKGK